MKQTVALVGNPNSGKTTLFNRLTGSKQHVGNWPGVTIEKKEGMFKVEEHEITLVDLPGIYSMSPYSMEEIVARDYIMKDHPDFIINIVDGTNIERNLYLSLQLKELGIPMVIAINMLDELKQNGIEVDLEALSKSLNSPVVGISAKNGTGMKELIHQLIHQANCTELFYDQDTEGSLQDLYKMMQGFEFDPTHRKFYAFKLLEDDHVIIHNFGMDSEHHHHYDSEDYMDEYQKSLSPQHRFSNELNQSIKADYSHYEQYQKLKEIQHAFCLKKNQIEIDMAVADTRYAFIGEVVAKAIHNKKQAFSLTLSDKIDRFATNKFLGIPLFFLILLIIFMVTFGPLGEILKEVVASGIGGVTVILGNALTSIDAPFWTQSLLIDAVLGGVGSVLSFMPQILLLFLFLSILEDSGYMARAAFLMDQMLRKIGLNGKAFIPMLMGFGCSVPAIMASRVMENEMDRKLTILLTPFMSCGARLPIYALFASIFFADQVGFAIFGMYVLGIAVAVACGFLLRNTVFKDNQSTFIMELPPYRLPSLQVTVNHVWQKCKGFLIKAGTVIFAMSVILWLFTNFTFTLQMTDQPELSILGHIGKLIAPLLVPLGFGHWQSAIALISGFIAKESVVSSMIVMYGVQSASDLSLLLSTVFTPLSAISFMTFTLLYMPCVAAVGAIKNETSSWKFTFQAILFQTGVAYLVSMLIYQVGSFFL